MNDLNNLILETVESYNTYLIKLPKGCQQIAEMFRIDQIQEALKEIKNFTEGIIWMTDASSLLKANDVSIDFKLEEMQDFFNEINDALTIQDYNLVADLFEYELVDYFGNMSLVKLK
ncbi:MAG: hypothetical protein UHX00_06975 [Caryophanon sp.]|nr:hypothetical protein [Caryophanon sp.]